MRSGRAFTVPLLVFVARCVSTSHLIFANLFLSFVVVASCCCHPIGVLIRFVVAATIRLTEVRWNDNGMRVTPAEFRM